MYCVIPNALYAGSTEKATDNAKLQKHSITHIIGLTTNQPATYPNIKYGCVRNICVQDNPQENIYLHFREVGNIIHSALMLGGRVLLHCHNGANLSPSFVIAYLMQHKNLKFNESLEVLRKSYPAANPHSSFVEQLEFFDYDLNKMEIC